MKILIVMSEGFDRYGPSRHLYDALISDILEKGHRIHLIQNYSFGNDNEIPQKFLGDVLFSYHSISYKKAKKKQFVKRYLKEFFYIKHCKKYIKKMDYVPDVVLVQSLVCAPFMMPMLKKYLKCPIVWNIQDMFPGASIANGVMRNKILQVFFYKLHKKAYRSSNYITVISEDMKDKVIEQGFSKDNIFVICDWYDDKTVEEIPWNQNEFVKKYNLKENVFYVQFAGTIGFNFDYKIVLNVAKQLKQYSDIVFQMIGFGSQYNIFQEKAEELRLGNIVFYPLQDQGMVSHVYSACSVSFIPLPKGVIGNSVPSKIALLMACKRPIISTADEESKYIKMINEKDFGYGLSTSDVDGVVQAIMELKQKRDLCINKGLNGFQYGRELYSRTFNTTKYINLFESIIKNK